MHGTIDLPPTLRFLVDAIGATVEPLRRIREPEGDFDAIVELAETHNLLTVMSGLCAQGHLELTGDEVQQLHQRTVTRTAAVMANEVLLGQLGDVLAHVRIPFLLFKGAALARTVYPTAAWRSYKDLDILIEREQYRAAAAALGEIGLEVIPGTNVRRRLKSFNAIAFYHPDRPQQRVDLHWNDVSVAWSGRSVLTGPKVWQEQHHIELAERRLPTLSVERTLIHLCVHWGCHHQFRSMISLLDLLLLLNRRPELDAGRIGAWPPHPTASVCFRWPWPWPVR